MQKQRKLKYKEIVYEGELVKVKTLAEHEMESELEEMKRQVLYILDLLYIK